MKNTARPAGVQLNMSATGARVRHLAAQVTNPQRRGRGRRFDFDGFVMREYAEHQVRVECQVAASHLTIVERRAPWRDDFGPEWISTPIARVRYTGRGYLDAVPECS